MSADGNVNVSNWYKTNKLKTEICLAYVVAKALLYASTGSKSIRCRDAHTVSGTASFTKAKGLNQARRLTLAGGWPKVERGLEAGRHVGRFCEKMYGKQIVL